MMNEEEVEDLVLLGEAYDALARYEASIGAGDIAEPGDPGYGGSATYASPQAAAPDSDPTIAIDAGGWIIKAQRLLASPVVPGATAGSPVAKVVVSPAGMQIQLGTPQQFTAQPLGANGSPVTPLSPTVSWNVSPPTGGMVDGSGNFNPQQPGQYTIDAAVDGVHGSTLVTVQGMMPGGGGGGSGGGDSGGGGGGGGDSGGDEGSPDAGPPPDDGGDAGTPPDDGGSVDDAQAQDPASVMADPYADANASDDSGDTSADDSEVGSGLSLFGVEDADACTILDSGLLGGGGGHGGGHHGGHGRGGRGRRGGWGPWGWWDGPYDELELYEDVDANEIANAVVRKLKAHVGADESAKKVGDYGLGEKVLALRETARHMAEDLKIIPAQVIYNAADKLAHDMLDAFPSGGAAVGPALLLYKGKVPAFLDRADAINGQLVAATSIDVYGLPWKPVLPASVDDFLSGENTSAAGDEIKEAYKTVADKISSIKLIPTWVWWVGGAVALVCLGFGLWKVIAMTRPMVLRLGARR